MILMEIPYWGFLLGMALGLGLGFIVLTLLHRTRLKTLQQHGSEIVTLAEKQAKIIVHDAQVQAKEEYIKQQEQFKAETTETRAELRSIEKRVSKREDNLEAKLDTLQSKEKKLEQADRRLADRSKAIEQKEAETNKTLEEQKIQLLRISGFDMETAKKTVLSHLEDEMQQECGQMIEKMVNEAKETAEEKSREIVITAIQRYAAAHTSSSVARTVDVPSDQMKGRVIGREGRNIRAFEKATGVDVIVDDTPGVVIVSAFDNVRREIAKLSLEKLIQDGRIHPSRIEEVVGETEKEMGEHIRRLGQEAAQEAGVPSLHEKVIELMGRLNFRVSYSQNVRRHSIEVAYLTGMLADLLGLDGTLARRCGFLHDIGKAADHEMEGGHPTIGADLLKRYGEQDEVVHAARGHHDDIRVEYPYTVLVAAADAISAARPGARRETLEKYVRRLEELEALACGFPGVDQSYAIQAGREIRVIVDSKRPNDREA
ncbi:MAG: ribonuclease Y, partial [Planctomycetes bacterium]|nr:ribonuclease Y [Planctomycetota bacterium]